MGITHTVVPWVKVRAAQIPILSFEFMQTVKCISTLRLLNPNSHSNFSYRTLRQPQLLQQRRHFLQPKSLQRLCGPGALMGQRSRFSSLFTNYTSYDAMVERATPLILMAFTKNITRQTHT